MESFTTPPLAMQLSLKLPIITDITDSASTSVTIVTVSSSTMVMAMLMVMLMVTEDTSYDLWQINWALEYSPIITLT